MKEKMLADRYVLGNLAILGQSTVIYAAPNAGKTLLTMWLLIKAIEDGNVNASDIFYINADDNHKGLTYKLELAEKYGFHMLAPTYNDFKTTSFVDYLKLMISNESAKGKVIILDTLKKFTNIMDKSVGTKFGVAIREFISHGGTVIMLAHVNKHKDSDGKVIYSGTSDVTDDVDCFYTLQVVNGTSSGKTVQFVNGKSRGDVVKSATYSYSEAENQTYEELLDSVRPVLESTLKEQQKSNHILASLKEHEEVITAISESIRSGIINRTELITSVSKIVFKSKSAVKEILMTHTGLNYHSGHRWAFTTGEKNAHTYTLISEPDPWE